MKSKTVHVHSGKRSRIAILSALALMGLFLSTGTTLAAEEFKLWRLVKPTEKSSPVTGFAKDEIKEKLVEPVKLLTPAKPTDLPKGVKDFATQFKKEPVQFAQVIKSVLIKTDSAKLDSVKKSLKETFAKFAKENGEDVYGSKTRTAAFEELLAKILKLTPEELKEEAWLASLFDDPALLLMLGLTDKDPSKKTEDDTLKPDPTKTEPPKQDDATKKALEEMTKKLEEQRRATEASQAQLAKQMEAMNRAQQLAQQQRPTSPVVGEQVSDPAADQRIAQQVCDLVNGNQKRDQDRQRELTDAFNALSNRFNQQQAQAPILANNNRKNDGFDKLAQLLNDENRNNNRNQQLQPFPQQQFPFPQTARREEPKNSFLDQPLVQPQQQPEQPILPPVQFPQSGNATAQGPLARPDVPSPTGARMALDTARNTLTQVKNQPSIANQLMQAQQQAQFNPMAALNPAISAKVQAEESVKRINMALSQVTEQASRLDEQLEELKDRATPPETKRREAQLTSELENKKRQYEQFKGMAGQNQDPNAREAIQAQAAQMAEELNRAETALTQFKSEVQIVDDETKSKMKSLAKLRDQLNTEKTNLEGELSTAKKDETTATQAVNTMETTIRSSFQQQQLPAGTPNVNRIQQTGGARSAPPRRLGQAGAMNATPGSTPSNTATMRGPLAK